MGPSLHTSTLEGNMEEVRTLIEAGVCVTKSDGLGLSALHYACSRGHLDIVKILVQSGAEVNKGEISDHYSLHFAYWGIFGGRNPSPLHFACAGGHIEIVELLLDAGADISGENIAGFTPLHLACQHGHFLKSGIMVEDRTGNSTALLLSCPGGHLVVVKRLIESGAGVNAKDSRGSSPLSLAARWAHEDLVGFLVDIGANVNEKCFCDYEHCTPLLIAVKNKHIGVALKLLGSGAEVNEKDEQGMTSLSLAAKNGYTEFVNLLVGRGANLNEKCKNHCTALHYAVKNKHVGVALKLLESGAEVNTKDEQGMTPLMSAAFSGSKELLIALVDWGAKLNEKCKTHCTALHRAITEYHLEIVKILLERGASVNEKTEKGDTALHLACKRYYSCSGQIVEMVRVIMKYEPDLDEKNDDDRTSMGLAGENEHVDVVNILMEAGAKIDREVPYIMRLFHKVCDENDLETVKKLLNAGVNINASDNTVHSRTPFLQAIYRGDLDFARFLLQNGASVNAQDRGCFSPLHYTGGSGRAEILRFLMDSGAHFNVRGKQGQTPLHQHCETGDIESVNTLLQYGADVNFNTRGDRPLHVVEGPHSAAIVQLLLQKGASVDVQNFGGRTPLHCHCENGNWDAVKALLNGGANVTIEDEDNNTPLHLISLPGAAEIIQLLCSKCPLCFINKSNKEGQIPLNRYCWLGKVGYVKILLDFGASVNQVDCDGMTPLHNACRRNAAAEFLEVLLSNGANPNQKTSHSSAPLHFVCAFGKIDAVRVLLKYGANIEDTNGENVRPIHLAGRKNDLGVVQILLQAGADVDGIDGEGRTLLHVASERGNVELARVLLEKGSDVNKIDRGGKSSIHNSAHSGSVQLVVLLVSRGANVNLQDSLGNTVLHTYFGNMRHVHTYRSGTCEFVETILEAGFDVNLKNNNGKVPLLLCTSVRVVQVIRILLEAGTKTQHLETDGIYLGSWPDSIVAMLLDYGVGHTMCKCDKCQGKTSVMKCCYSNSNKLKRYRSFRREYLSYDTQDILKKHSVKVLLAGLQNPSDFSVFLQNPAESYGTSALKDDDLSTFRNRCKKELVAMKMKVIGDSCITYFDLLRCGNPTAMHIKNLPWSLSADLCRQQFPIYGDMVYSKFVHLRKPLLVEKCGSFFELANLDLPQLPEECVSMIFELLTLPDLTKVAQICDSHRQALAAASGKAEMVASTDDTESLTSGQEKLPSSPDDSESLDHRH